MKHLSIIAFTLIAPLTVLAQTTIFSDNFSTSTLNSTTPTGPTATSTDWQIISGKSWNPAPSISAGSLKYGIAATSSGAIEAQALFSSTPISLANVGDSLTLSVVFTDTAGILTGNMFLGIGMYNSGGSGPVPGGLNGLAVSSTNTFVTGYVQNWQGYVGQIAYNGFNSRIMNRQMQTGAGNNNQNLTASGSSSQAYANPSAATVGSTSPSTVVLTVGQQYTDVLTYTLTGSGLQINSSLYSGVGTGGALLSSVTGTAAVPLTTSFDGLAIGWIERASQATTIDLNQVTVTAVIVPEPSTLALVGLGALGLVLARRMRR